MTDRPRAPGRQSASGWYALWRTLDSSDARKRQAPWLGDTLGDVRMMRALQAALDRDDFDAVEQLALSWVGRLGGRSTRASNAEMRRTPLPCPMCGAVALLTRDHWIPRAKGGAKVPNNIVWMCSECNAAKGSKTPWELGWTRP